jgi:hypothetical protein
MGRSFTCHSTHRSRRWRRIAPAAVLAFSTIVVTPPAASAQTAEPPTQAICHVDVPQVTMTPGLSATPAKGSGQSGSGSTIRCVGTLRGVTLAGDPGPLTVTFTYGNGPLSSLTGGDTCLGGSGDGTVSAIVPTIRGESVSLTGPIHFGFLGPLASFYGHFDNLVFAGIGEPVPDLSTVQDCLTTPITKFSIRGQFGLKNL